MEILERHDAMTRLRRHMRSWRIKPNTGNFAKDALFLLCIVFLQTTVLPYFLGEIGFLDLVTPWLIITFIRQRPAQGTLLALIGGLALETRLGVPAGLYLCSYWMLANIIFQVRPALSWRYKTPWLACYCLATLFIQLFEIFVLNFLDSPVSFETGHYLQLVIRFIIAVTFGMYLSKEWMTIDAEEPVPQ